MRFLSLALLFMAIVSCSGKKSSNASFQLVMTGQNLSVAGGLVVYGKNLSNSDSFIHTMASTGQMKLDLSHGTWFMAAVGWEGAGLTGTTSCAFTTSAEVKGSKVTIDLSLSESNCFNSSFTTDVGHGTPLRFAKNSFYFCNSILSTLPVGANCSNDPTQTINHKGYIGSFKVMIKTTSGDLSSDCYSPSGINLDITGNTNNLNLAGFTGHAALPYEVVTYLDESCGDSRGEFIRKFVNSEEVKIAPVDAQFNNTLVQVQTSDVCAKSDLLALTTDFASGRGTIDDPYVICNEKQFGILQQNYPTYKTKSFVLGRDINLLSGLKAGTIGLTPYHACLKDGDTFIPFGKEFDASCNLFEETGSFDGMFDGNNHTLTNFRFSSEEEDDIALFRELGATAEIYNLKISRSDVQGKNNVATLVAHSAGTLKNIHVSDARISAKGDYAGGIVSQQTGTPLSHLFVHRMNLEGVNYVGGVVGFTTTRVTSASFDGKIESRHGITAGGIAGQAAGITQAVSTGSINANGTNVGGIVGISTADTYDSRSDMFIQTVFGSGENKVGGIVGSCETGCSLVTRSLFYGKIQTKCASPSCNMGGIAGDASSVTSSLSTQTLAGLGGQNGSSIGTIAGAWNISSAAPMCTAGTFSCLPDDVPRLDFEQSDCQSAVNNSITFSSQSASGSADSPYIICNPMQWAAINNSGHYKLAQNINLTYASTSPSLSGSLDGDFKIMFGFNGNDTTGNNALLTEITSTGIVKNLILAGTDLYTGAAGYNPAALAIDNNGLISRVEVRDIHIESNVKPNTIGGVVVNNYGTITSVNVTGRIRAQETMGGVAYNNMGIIEKSISRVLLDGSSDGSSNGFLGGIAAVNNKIIRTSTFRGSVQFVEDTPSIGGIVGSMEYLGTGAHPSITDSHVTEEAKFWIGDNSSFVGGIVGSNNNTNNSITRSIFAGTILSTPNNTSGSIGSIYGGGATPTQLNNHYFRTPLKEIDSIASNSSGSYAPATKTCFFTVIGISSANNANTFGAINYSSGHNYVGTMVYATGNQYSFTIPDKSGDECVGITANSLAGNNLYRGNAQPQVLNLTAMGTYSLADKTTVTGNDVILTAYKTYLEDPTTIPSTPDWIYEEGEGLRLFYFD